MSKIIEYLINFIKNTGIENITAVTIAVELLSKFTLQRDEIKSIVESAIKSITYFIDVKKKNRLLELNLKVTIYFINFCSHFANDEILCELVLFVV